MSLLFCQNLVSPSEGQSSKPRRQVVTFLLRGSLDGLSLFLGDAEADAVVAPEVLRFWLTSDLSFLCHASNVSTLDHMRKSAPESMSQIPASLTRRIIVTTMVTNGKAEVNCPEAATSP